MHPLQVLAGHCCQRIGLKWRVWPGQKFFFFGRAGSSQRSVAIGEATKAFDDALMAAGEIQSFGVGRILIQRSEQGDGVFLIVQIFAVFER